MNMSDKYAMYLRKSRADIELEALGEGETLKKHKEMLYALAERHEIHPDQITEYQEIVSGESIQDRPKVQKLLHDVYQKKYKGVLVVEIERLARGNTKDQGEVADAFQYSNTMIITPAKVYDPNNEFDQEYFEFGLFMSRREYKTIRRRLEAGKTQAVIDGNYLLPQRIFGYDICKKGKNDRFLVINEDEAKIVHMIFDWFTVDRKTVGWIARQLTLMGITPMKRKREWSKETIKCMLKNKHYIGLIEWGVNKTVKKMNPETGKFSKVRVKSEPDDIIIANGKHEAIISKEQFDLVQSLMNKKNQSPVKYEKTIVNPLAGILHCAKCGKSMGRFDAKHGRTIRYHHRDSAVCKVKSLPVDTVLDALVESLESSIKDFELKRKSDYSETERNRHIEMIKKMESELSKMERKRIKLFDDYEDEIYTKNEFIERKHIYNKSIDNLKQQIEESKKETPTAVDYSERITTMHHMIECIKDTEIDAKAKNDFLKLFIEDIKYDAIDYGKGNGGKPVLDVILK